VEHINIAATGTMGLMANPGIWLVTACRTKEPPAARRTSGIIKNGSALESHLLQQESSNDPTLMMIPARVVIVHRPAKAGKCVCKISGWRLVLCVTKRKEQKDVRTTRNGSKTGACPDAGITWSAMNRVGVPRKKAKLAAWKPKNGWKTYPQDRTFNAYRSAGKEQSATRTATAPRSKAQEAATPARNGPVTLCNRP
jgi:hypothetical protein